jgi:DNA-binding MarR family transcriptional regulator
MTGAALARLEQISPQSMGATLAGLEARGLVARRADPDDGRQVVMSITVAGVEALRTRRDVQTEQIAAALAHEFTPSEVRRLMKAAPLIERLAQTL